MVKYLDFVGDTTTPNNYKVAWDVEMQRQIREADYDTVIRFSGRWLLNDQIQNLGSSRRWEIHGEFSVVPRSGGTACFLFRNMDNFTLHFGGYGKIRYSDDPTANPATGLVYFIDVVDGRVENATLENLKRINGIVMEAREKNCVYSVSNSVINWADESYRTSHHVSIRLKSKLLFLSGVNSTRDNIKAGARPSLADPGRVVNGLIHSNVCNGGYYGVDFSGVDHGRIVYNTVTNNERGISVQDSSEAIDILYNHVHNHRSAGIHIAYGSNGCNAAYNVIDGSASNGEALMQSYVWTSNTLFRRNALASTNKPTYAFQGSLGIGLTVEECTADMEGGVAKALVADEQSWDPGLHQAWHSRSNAESTNEGLELVKRSPDYYNRVVIKNSTLLSKVRGTPVAVVTNVKDMGNKGPVLSIIDSQFSIPGKSDILQVGSGAILGGEASSYLPDEHVSSYTVGSRKGDRFISDDKHLQEDYGFIADDGSGGGSTPAPAPTPPTPAPSPVDEAGTLKEGTKTKQLVVFATRPETGTNQWGDWLAFFEMENGEVTKWPEQVDIPQWVGKRTFPCIILPVNGSISSPLANLIRTVITLDGQGYLATHPSIKGVQWYARNQYAEVANARVTREKTSAGEVPVKIEESPQNYNGTVGQACPSGYATFVWVRKVGATLTCQYVAVRNAVPVQSPDNDAYKASITFTNPKGFPAIVWEGDKLPADENFRNLRRSYITIPAEFSGNTGVMSVPTSAISNSAHSKLVLGTGAEGELPDSQVKAWYGENAPLTPNNGNSGGSGGTTQSGGSGNVSSQTIIDAAIRGTLRGHEINYPGWTNPRGAYKDTRTVGAQVRGGAVTIGGTLKLGDLRGSKLYESGFDGAFGSNTSWLNSHPEVLSTPAKTLQDWCCLLPGANAANAWVDLRNCRLYVLHRGETRWRLMFDNRAPVDWTANQGPSMNPGNTTERSLAGGSLELQKKSTGTTSSIILPSDTQRNAHFGPGDFSTANVVDKGIDLSKVYAVCTTVEARLSPGYENREVGLQMGVDPKWGATPSGWFPGLYVSRLMKLTPQWTLYSMFNSSEALDSERGAVTITPAFFRNTTFPV